ncbi:MAG: hypothetical protein ABIS14_08505, partial [Sphingomonas sp.]
MTRGGRRIVAMGIAALFTTGCIPRDPLFDAPPPRRDAPDDRRPDYPPQRRAERSDDPSSDRYEPQRVDDDGQRDDRRADP